MMGNVLQRETLMNKYFAKGDNDGTIFFIGPIFNTELRLENNHLFEKI